MASPKETEQAKARRWLKRHRGKIPPRIRIEQGTKVPLGETGYTTPVVKLDEETVSPVNNTYPTDSKPVTLTPWPGSDATDISLRPTEDEAIENLDDV